MVAGVGDDIFACGAAVGETAFVFSLFCGIAAHPRNTNEVEIAILTNFLTLKIFAIESLTNCAMEYGKSLADYFNKVPWIPAGNVYAVSFVAMIMSPFRVKQSPTTLLPVTNCSTDRAFGVMRTMPCRPR